MTPSITGATCAQKRTVRGVHEVLRRMVQHCGWVLADACLWTGGGVGVAAQGSVGCMQQLDIVQGKNTVLRTRCTQ